MSVKRYEFEDYGTNEDDGRYVTYEDYVALEARYAALAAENANCRKAVQVFCDVVDANTDAICEEVGQDGVKAILAAMSATGNMPATEAFLAEVRAQGVDSAINTVIAMMNHQHPVASKAIDILRVHAYQLRKGVQS
ncbi:hypothetical protein [Enterobacter asburiae]|uniref:hypothetical protein n=1 Tax=Enterobacter asburiae TaxID=61645 RepID=UPI002FE650DA